MRSLQSRLGLSLSLVLIVVFIILWLIINNAIRSLAEDYIVSRLSHDADSLIAAIDFDASGVPHLNTAKIDSLYQQPFSGHYYKITAAAKTMRSRSLWDEDMAVPPSGPEAGGRRYVSGPQEQTLLVLQRRFNKQGHALDIAVAEDFSPIQADIAAFQTRFALVALMTLFVLIGLQILILKGGLLPLKRVRQQIHELEQGRRDRLDCRVPEEIQPLVDETNRLFALLASRLQRYRNALGDLAHALKRPLTILRQLAGDPSITRQPELHADFERQIVAMQHLTERILKRERLAANTPVAKRFVPERDLGDLVATLEAIHKEKNIGITTRLQRNSSLPFDRDDMLELVGNLLDNACKWSRETVRLTLEQNNDHAVIVRVEDDGPGIEPDQQQLLQRGARLDESVHGYGIGLSIVQDIVSQYHGDISFAKSVELAGLQVEVRLPNPQPSK